MVAANVGLQSAKVTHTASDGLCSTCRHQANCVYPRNSVLPVVQCEEFEIEVTPAPPATGAASRVAPKPDRNRRKYLGLCENCESRETCGFPRPDGGVWHCEEYQ